MYENYDKDKVTLQFIEIEIVIEQQTTLCDSIELRILDFLYFESFLFLALINRNRTGKSKYLGICVTRNRQIQIILFYSFFFLLITDALCVI